MSACDFHDAAGRPDECTGPVSGGGDWPWACDGYVAVVELTRADEAWHEIAGMRRAHRAGIVDAMLDTLADFLFDGTMPCGCRLDRSVMCADHTATETAKYPAGVLA